MTRKNNGSTKEKGPPPKDVLVTPAVTQAFAVTRKSRIRKFLNAVALLFLDKGSDNLAWFQMAPILEGEECFLWAVMPPERGQEYADTIRALARKHKLQPEPTERMRINQAPSPC